MYRRNARAEVVAGLLAAGGRVEHESGRATLVLAQHVAETTGQVRSQPSLTPLLAAMDDDEQIHRVTRGRRTYTIALAAIENALLAEAGRLLVDSGQCTPEQAADMVRDAGFAAPLGGAGDVPDSAPQVRAPGDLDDLLGHLEQLPDRIRDLQRVVHRQQEIINELTAELEEHRRSS